MMSKCDICYKPLDHDKGVCKRCKHFTDQIRGKAFAQSKEATIEASRKFKAHLKAYPNG